MVIVDEKGRIFGAINIFDLAILSFVLIIVAALFLYSKYPPQLKEHKDVVFQMYFTDVDVPDAIAQQIFVPGTSLIATYAKLDKAVIISTQKNLLPAGTTVFLVTINSSLEIDSEGDLLFNGNDVAPGNTMYIQVGTSYLPGKIWRVDYEHHIETKEVTVMLDNNDLPLPSQGTIVYDTLGNEIGEVTTIKEQEGQLYLTLSVQADVYDGAYFVSEIPLQPFAPIYFIANNNMYEGAFIEGASS